MRDYEELVERLRAGTYTVEELSVILPQAADAIEELVSNADKFKWISVEERLPEEKGKYIIAYHPCYWNDVNYDKIKLGTDTFMGKVKWARRKYRRVTHWMPLPEPPKEDDDERWGETDEGTDNR